MSNIIKKSSNAKKQPFTRFGLAFKVIMLTVLPLIIVGTVNVVISIRGSSLLNDTLESVNQENSERTELFEASENVKESLNSIRNGFASVSGVHQRSLLLGKPSLVEETLVAREGLKQNFDGLHKKIIRLQEVYETQARGENIELQQKRLQFLEIRAKKMPKNYTQFEKANNKTIEYIQSGDTEKGIKRLLREQNARSKVEKILDTMAVALSEFNVDAKLASDEHHQVFTKNIRTDMEDLLVANIAVQVSAVALLTIMSFAYGVLRISKPLTKIVGDMDVISNGKLDVEIPQNRRDEIGKIAASLEVFRNSLRDNERLRDQREKDKAKAEKEREEAKERLANEFDACVGDIIGKVSKAVGDLSQATGNMTSAANKNLLSAGKATESSETTRSNIQSVAAATEELSSSINEINRQVQESSTACNQAVDDARQSKVVDC